MNANEVKEVLRLYRPGTADADDPQVAEALAQAKDRPELAAWLKAQQAQHEILVAKFRQIAPPAGLKEQIVSEYAARQRVKAASRLLWVSAAAVVILLGTLTVLWHPPGGPENPLANYQNRMVRAALSGYSMDLLTNSPVAVREYLAGHQAPADFNLPAPLQHAVLVGCAVRDWQGASVSLICFRTGKPLPPGSAADLWLFVVDKGFVVNSPASGGPQIAKVNRLATATWTEGGKLYFLGVAGGEGDVRHYL